MSTSQMREQTRVPSRRTVPGAPGAAIAAAVTVSAALGEASTAAGEADRVTYRDKQILVDGRSALVLGGEIRHFRLAHANRQPRLGKAKDAGLNALATSIPWMWHGTPDGTIDVTGRSRPERDLRAFLGLCVADGFDVAARPGPFAMAVSQQ
ncbi:beta-galactosidase [Streptomyces sp. NPDC047706]|uniref:beta-galactosidase n=1 Tax=Streptomyces sp. NPDC047706 TaxID=3365486 RepID=UPI003720B190